MADELPGPGVPLTQLGDAVFAATSQAEHDTIFRLAKQYRAALLRLP